MRFKCVIFDFDGVLFDSMYIWNNVAENYIKSIGKIPDKNINEKVKNMSLYQSAIFLKRKYNLSFSIDNIINDINRIIDFYYTEIILPKDGVIDFIKEIKENETFISIATSSDKKLVEKALTRCRMIDYFDNIFTCGEFKCGKDSPIIFRNAMNYFGCNRSNTIIFEDNIQAINTAKNDNFTVVGVFDESEKNQKEVIKNSDFYINNFKDNKKLFDFIFHKS